MAERGIEETLRVLEMEEDSDLDPAIAAQMAAERVANSGKTEVPGSNDDDEEEEEEEGEEEEEEEEVAAQQPPKPPRQGKRGPRFRRGEEEEPGIMPVTPALVPPPRVVKGQAKAKSPSVGKMGRGIADKVPGAERVKVYKREDGGQRWFVKDYTTNDLAGFPDFESFLTRYVKPGYGAGEYDLVGVDAHNREMPLGTIRLRDPDTKGGTGELTDLLKTVMTTQQERDENYLKRMQALHQQPTVNPMEMLQGAIEMQERLTGKANAEGGGALSAAMRAMSESSNQTMTMMMAMMQQQQAAADRSNQMMMTLLAKPKDEDPTMKLILMKLLEGGMGGGGSVMPPPPPPSKTEGLSDILQAMAAFMGAMGGGGGEDDSKTQLIDFLKQMALKDSGGMSTKEVLQLVMQKSGEPGTDDFRKAVDNMATMMNIANTLRQQSEPGGSAGFFDALGALLGNRDIIGAVANTIRSKTDATDAQKRAQMEAERQRLELASRMQQRDRVLAAQAAQAAQQQQLPAPVQQAAAPVQQPVAPQPPPVVPSPEAQRAAENYIKRTGKPIPQLPNNTHDHINMIAAAEDEGQLVARTVALFIYFAEYEDWRPFSERLLGLIRDGNKKEAMDHLTAFFEGLAQIKLIDPALMKRIFKAMDANFESVMQNLGDFSKEEENGDEVSGADLVATAEGLSAEGP